MPLVFLILIGFAVNAMVSAATSVITQGVEKGWENINIAQALFDGCIGGISGALAMSGLGVISLSAIGAGLGFVGGVGDALLSGADMTSLDTWIGVGMSALIGGISGLAGGPGARNAKALNQLAKNNPTKAFIQASRSYNKVLTRVAQGGYSSLGRANAARVLSGRNLAKAWNDMVNEHITSSLKNALINSNSYYYALTLLKSKFLS